jgi:hypothetical protein
MSSTTKPMGGRPKHFGTGMVETLPECGGGGGHGLRILIPVNTEEFLPHGGVMLGTKQ